MTSPDPTLQDNGYSVDIGVMVNGVGGQRWMRAAVNPPCVPRIGDWVHVGESLVTVARIELRDVSSSGAHIDVLAESIRSNTQTADELIEECLLTAAGGWR